jgi:hypothetical protein
MPPLPSGTTVPSFSFPGARGAVGPVVDLVDACGTSFSA